MTKRIFAHINPFFIFGLFSLISSSDIYSQTINVEIESVRVIPDNSVEIYFNIAGADYENIDAITINVYSNLDDQTDYEPIIIEEDFTSPIVLPANSQVQEIALGFIMMGQVSNGAFLTDLHRVIFLEHIETFFEDCSAAIHAIWMNYAIFDPALNSPPKPLPFDSLQILMSEYDPSTGNCYIGEERVIYQDVQSYWDDEANIQLPDDISPGPQQYCFRVMSYSVSDPDLYAYSNMISGVQISDLDTPDKVDLISVDVIDNEHIEVQLEVDDLGFGQFEYTLFRSDNINTGFEQVLPPREHDSQVLVFIDETMPDLQSNPWFYYVEVDMKECPGDYGKDSNRASSIFLQAEISPGFDPEFSDFVEIDLSWEHDPAWDEYILKRRFFDSDWEVVPNFNYTEPDFSFTDEVDVETAENGISYILEAENASMDGSISSNIAMIGVEIEDVYINPISVSHNALRPDSDFAENKVFLPDQFDDLPTSYSMSIFDRNGLLVFSTNDYDEAWDGTINGPDGNPAPAGAYVYQITITDAAGDHHNKKGVVYLIR